MLRLNRLPSSSVVLSTSHTGGILQLNLLKPTRKILRCSLSLSIIFRQSTSTGCERSLLLCTVDASRLQHCPRANLMTGLQEV